MFRQSVCWVVAALGIAGLCTACSPKEENSPTEGTASASTLLKQILLPRMIGADRAYLEQFTGVARNTYGNRKIYQVQSCELEVTYAGSTVSAMGMDVSEQCTFDLAPFIQEQKPIAAHQLTFGDFDRLMSDHTGYYADCLWSSCGNAYDPAVYSHFSGPHALQFLEIMASTIHGDQYILGLLMREQMGDDWVLNGQYNCESGRYTPKARELFAQEGIKRIEIGYGLLEHRGLTNDCSPGNP